MLERCYDKKFQEKNPAYLGCTVCKEWLTFNNFKTWVKAQYWQGMHLDKDIKVIGNKIYSPSTCLLVTHRINNLLTDNKSKRGGYPQGVSLNKASGKYEAQCRVDGKQNNLGCFITPEEASNVYKEFKHKVITKAAGLPENEYIREYLLNHAALLIGMYR